MYAALLPLGYLLLFVCCILGATKRQRVLVALLMIVLTATLFPIVMKARRGQLLVERNRTKMILEMLQADLEQNDTDSAKNKINFLLSQCDQNGVTMQSLYLDLLKSEHANPMGRPEGRP